MKLFKNKFLTIARRKPTVIHQTGGVEVFIVIIVVLIAFLLAGGEFLLGNAFPLPDSLGIGGGSSTPGGGGDGTSGGSQNSIVIQNKGCIGPLSSTTVIVTNSNPGYISLEISNGAGGFAVVETREFKNTPTSIYELKLPNELGFDKTPWRVRLFEGGTNTNGDFTGGTEKASENGTPTNC